MIHSPQFNNMDMRLVLAIVAILSPMTNAHKILLYPWSQGFNSHVLDFVAMAGFLQEAGHDVHFLCTDSSIAPIKNRGFTSHTFRAPNITPQSDEYQDNLLEPGYGGLNLLVQLSESGIQYCRNFLKDSSLQNELKNYNFDLLIYDLGEECGNLVAHILDLPTIIYSPVGYVSAIPGGFPNLPSFVPSVFSPYASRMTFSERVANVLFDAIVTVIGPVFFEWPFSRLASEFNTTYDPWITAKTILLSRSHAAIDFQRPILPTVIDIGDAFFQPSKALTLQLEDFMTSAGHHGVVVVSFGTLLATLPDKYAVVFSRVFSRLPQKVIWRYKGHLPEVGNYNNTMLVDWLPQNDLLGHNQTRLFITHCGMSSTFEAAGHGVPVIAMPVFGDQNQNAVKLTRRAGMGRTVDLFTITESKLQDAISDVLSDPLYANNARQTSLLLRDQPISAQNRTLWYVDHVARHKGARHLLVDSLHELSAFQLYSLDVYAFLALCGGATLAILYFLFTFVLRKLCVCFRNSKEHKD